jgi:carbon-monoxide dehydrogenase medium subunit
LRSVEYVAPRTLDEAVTALAGAGPTGRVLSGGTDIIIQAREGRKDVSLFVDVKKVPETMTVSIDKDGLTIGASVPCAELYENPEIARRYPALIDSASLIGGIQIQSRASLGGNLCNSSPAADSIPTLIVLGATCQIAGPDRRREIPVEDFCTGPGTNALEPGEILVALRLPAPEPNSGAAFERFIPRNEMDIAVCNAAASVRLNADQTRFEAARIAVGAVAPTPLLVKAAADALAGQDLSAATIASAAEEAGRVARPITDMRGSIAQRKHLATVLTRRVIERAVERARSSQ